MMNQMMMIMKSSKVKKIIVSPLWIMTVYVVQNNSLNVPSGTVLSAGTLMRSKCSQNSFSDCLILPGPKHKHVLHADCASHNAICNDSMTLKASFTITICRRVPKLAEQE